MTELAVIIKDYNPMANIEKIEPSLTKDESSILDTLNFEKDESISDFNLEKIESKDNSEIKEETIIKDPEIKDTELLEPKKTINDRLSDFAFRIPVDYFKYDEAGIRKEIKIHPSEIIQSKIAKEFNINYNDLAVTKKNQREVDRYLSTGKPHLIKPYSIDNGIIAVGHNFLVLIDFYNKKGLPGRLSIVYSKYIDKDFPTPLIMEEGGTCSKRTGANRVAIWEQSVSDCQDNKSIVHCLKNFIGEHIL
jgi:hypothetical protein